MEADRIDLDTHTGTMIVGGRLVASILVDISDLNPRLVVHGTSISTLRLPKGGACISIQSWIGAGGDARAFNEYVSQGRVDSITFHMLANDFVLEIVPPRRRIVWDSMDGPRLLEDFERAAEMFIDVNPDVDMIVDVWRRLTERSRTHAPAPTADHIDALNQLVDWGVVVFESDSIKVAPEIQEWIKGEMMRDISVPIATRTYNKRMDSILIDEGVDETPRTKTTKRCGNCNGRGMVVSAARADLVDCMTCTGTGKVVAYK